MDRAPSFPHHQNPSPNFFSRPPPLLQNPNTYPIAPSPPPIRDLSGTLSSLQSLISECQRTLDSLSQNLALDHSSLLLQKENSGGFVRCPFDPNHLIPPEALFLHSLRCPNPIDLTHLLGSFSCYRNTLELPCEVQSNIGDGGDICFSLDEFTDFETNFFYKDCPGAVNFSELDRRKRIVTLPSVLSLECSDFVRSDENESKSMLDKWLVILPSDLCAIRTEIDQWRDYPISYSFSILTSILGSKSIGKSEFSSWILVNSTRYGVIIDTYMRDHIFLLFRLSLEVVVKEACGFMVELVGEENMSCRSRKFECAVLVRVLSWLASQLAILYGEGNGKFFALDMFKQCIVESASRLMLFPSERATPESSAVLEGLDDASLSRKVGETLDSAEVISVSRVAAAVAALYERSVLEGKTRAIRYPQPLTRYQRVAELGAMTAKADEERRKRPSYRAIIDHDGRPRQPSSNEEMNKMKTKEELLAEERDYKRRRMSYRGKNVKRTPRQVLRDIIEEYTEEIKLAGGIGCFEKPSSISTNQKETDFGYNTASSTLSDASPRLSKRSKGENNRGDTEYAMEIRTNTDKRKRYEEHDSGGSRRQQSHRSSYKHGDERDDEYTRSKRYSVERKSSSHHQTTHRSSHRKSSSEYKTKRDDDRRSQRSRNENAFED